jgi:hypothetical protein
MSYLDLPRLHFSGLFYAGPNTINNVTENYTPSVQIEDSAGQYLPVAGWNANGVAQWWLEECSVWSGVDPAGHAITSGDPVIGAAVETPSPKTPKTAPNEGFLDIAKMVDLDPDQQGRSELYGIRLFVTLPGGAGFTGQLTVPNLRQLNPRIPVSGGSWTAVGSWMGVLQNVSWIRDVSGSALLSSLKASAGAGISVKLTVDLHQNNPRNQFTSGDLFCYGRILGVIGPALAGELAQVVPGRCLVAPPAPRPESAPVESAVSRRSAVPAREAAAAKAESIGLRRSVSSALEAGPLAVPVSPWNPAFAVLRKAGSQASVHVDIGGSILLTVQTSSGRPVATGEFEVSQGISVGVINSSTNVFQAFANGNLSFTPQYQQLASMSKNCVLVKNSGVFTVPLTASEASLANGSPLAITVNGQLVLSEPATGLWMDVSPSTERLETNGSATAQVMVRKFGTPFASQQPPVTPQVLVFEWEQQGDGSWNASLNPSTDLQVTVGATDANGLATVTTRPAIQTFTVPAIRQPLDSQVYYIDLVDAQQNPIGDGGATLSVLLWRPYQAPAQPGWQDVAAIFGAYARLYPGMKARMDISDQPTVKSSAADIRDRMLSPITDPAHMPVTRDLSPSKVKMIVTWLNQFLSQSASA